MSRRPIAVAVAALALAGACTMEQAYRQDERLEVVSPRERAEVRLPVRIAWKAEDFVVSQPAWSASAAATRGTEGDGYFAVFVDRPPLAPGVEFLSIATADPECKANPACPDAKYFADRGIHLTTQTELELETLVDRRRTDSAKDWHEATIVFVDDDSTGNGEIGEVRRIGTAAVTVRFVVERS
ncbi:MAG: hypothetical protein KY443_01335 [Actinobacteria bacterium]|nr:hypothetical protein [Actinomycetota bacterium]